MAESNRHPSAREGNYRGYRRFLQTLFGPIGSLFHYVFFLPVFNVLMLIYHVIPNFAISIILLTLLIRCALIPLTRAQLRSSRAMQEILPN